MGWEKKGIEPLVIRKLCSAQPDAAGGVNGLKRSTE